MKEHLAPSLQEPKIVIASAVEKTGNANSGLVRLAIKVKNTGAPSVILLQDNRTLYKLVQIKPATEIEFLNRLNSFLEEGNGNSSIERASIIKPGAVLATGSLALGSLHPGESASFSKLINPPRDIKEAYRSIAISFAPKSKSPESSLELQWKYNHRDDRIKPFICMANQSRKSPSAKMTYYGHQSKTLQTGNW